MELWHLVEEAGRDEVIRAEVRQVWYIGVPKHYVFTSRPEQYATEGEAKAAAEAFVATDR